jgi:hypothetical protein
MRWSASSGYYDCDHDAGDDCSSFCTSFESVEFEDADELPRSRGASEERDHSYRDDDL